jgi:hypothetical protein
MFFVDQCEQQRDQTLTTPAKTMRPRLAISIPLCHAAAMNYEIDKPSSENEGDGLPNMCRRLRIIFASAVGCLVIWVAVISLIR